MDFNIRMGNGGRRHEDDDRSNTTQITGPARWVFLGVILAVFAGAFFFMGSEEDVEATPEEACRIWAQIDTKVRNTGEAQSYVERRLRRIRSYGKEDPQIEELASDLLFSYRNGTVNPFDKQDLTEACRAYS